MKKIAIVGGGLSGLAAAYQLELEQEKHPCEVHLFESSARLGGVLQTDSVEGYLIEHSADMFTTEPSDALELVRELGHESDLISTRSVSQRACIAFDGRLHNVPAGFSLMQPTLLQPILESSLLSWEGKARLLSEMHLDNSNEPKSGADECLAGFATRRFGKETFERLIQPLAAGIYTADPEKLSMNATMERFVDSVATHGSLIRAGMKAKSAGVEQQASGARYNLFRAPRKGMGQLVSWLTESLRHTEMHFDSPVSKVEPDESGWSLESAQGSEFYDGVMMSISPPATARLLSTVDPILCAALESIESASSAIVVIGAKSSQFEKPFPGYGVIFPSCENSQLIACSFSSNKFEGRAPNDRVLVRGFLGGALSPERFDEPDEKLIGDVVSELQSICGFQGEAEFSHVFRWRNSMPQYHVGHEQVVEKIENLVDQIGGLELAGNGYKGVGIPLCIRSGRTAATRLVNSVGHGSE